MEFKTASSTTSTSSALSLLAVDETNVIPYKIPSNHFAELDSSTNKLLNTQIPDSILGGVIYKGVWNAATNVPAIITGSATSVNKGYYYKTSVAGSTTVDGTSTWSVGDWIISNGTTWDRIITTESSYGAFTGATGSAAGLTGLVPAPNAGMQNYALLGSGSFGVVSTAAGGTGATSTSAARTNLGIVESTNYVDIGTIRIQWGTTASSSITFPVTFKDTNYSFTANINSSDGTSEIWGIHIAAKTTTDITIVRKYDNAQSNCATITGTSYPASWIAIGLKP